MNATTLGQAFRDTLRERWIARGRCVDTRDYDALPQEDRDDLEAAAQAVIDAATEGSLRACGYTLADVGRFLEAEAAAQEPKAAPELAAATRMILGRCPVHAGKVHAQIGDDHEMFCLRDLADTAEAVGNGDPSDAEQSS